MLKGADAAVVEGYSYGSPRGAGSQAHSIGELGGVFRLLCYRRAIPLAVVAPTQLKKYATGKGNATKDEVVAAIASRTGLHFPGPGANDKYDAWVLWQMACYHYEPDRAYPMPKSHTSVTQEVKWPRLEEVSRPDASTSEPIDA
jgi:crossover junction endodeoxyribonuclease RuvC